MREQKSTARSPFSRVSTVQHSRLVGQLGCEASTGREVRPWCAAQCPPPTGRHHGHGIWAEPDIWAEFSRLWEQDGMEESHGWAEVGEMEQIPSFLMFTLCQAACPLAGVEGRGPGAGLSSWPIGLVKSCFLCQGCRWLPRSMLVFQTAVSKAVLIFLLSTVS